MSKEEKRQRSEVSGGLIVLVVGLALMGPTVLKTGFFSNSGNHGMLLAGMIVAGVGAVRVGVAVFGGRRLPKKEVMRFAEGRGGLVTLSEVATGLDVEPEVAKRALLALSKEGIAVQRWAEVRKNLWEFPDYMKLPLGETIERAKGNGGKVSVEDLMGAGHSEAVARETLEVLREKGLAEGGGRAVEVTAQ